MSNRFHRVLGQTTLAVALLSAPCAAHAAGLGDSDGATSETEALFDVAEYQLDGAKIIIAPADVGEELEARHACHVHDIDLARVQDEQSNRRSRRLRGEEGDDEEGHTFTLMHLNEDGFKNIMVIRAILSVIALPAFVRHVRKAKAIEPSSSWDSFSPDAWAQYGDSWSKDQRTFGGYELGGAVSFVDWATADEGDREGLVDALDNSHKYEDNDLLTVEDLVIVSCW